MQILRSSDSALAFHGLNKRLSNTPRARSRKVRVNIFISYITTAFKPATILLRINGGSDEGSLINQPINIRTNLAFYLIFRLNPKTTK